MKTHESLRFALIPPTLLTLAHVLAMAALLGFGMRAGAYPFHRDALPLYLVTVPVALLAIVWLARRSSRSQARGTLELLVVSAPALASLALVGTLWLSPWLGGAPYAPYDMQDIEAVLLFSHVPAVAFVVIAMAYGSPNFLLVAGGAQLVVYFGTHALPNWIRWPGSDLLGVNPFVATQLFSVYAVGLLATILRRRLLPGVRPGLWLAAAVVGVLGGYLLLSTLSPLPENGAYLGYLATGASTDTRYLVPPNAWDWSRPSALVLAGLAVTAGALLPVLVVGRSAGYDPHKENSLT